MKINFKIVAGILAAGWAYEAYANCYNVKMLKTQIKKLSALADFHASKLDEAKVPLTDFDKIVMNEIAR